MPKFVDALCDTVSLDKLIYHDGDLTPAQKQSHVLAIHALCSIYVALAAETADAPKVAVPWDRLADCSHSGGLQCWTVIRMIDETLRYPVYDWERDTLVISFKVGGKTKLRVAH